MNPLHSVPSSKAVSLIHYPAVVAERAAGLKALRRSFVSGKGFAAVAEALQHQAAVRVASRLAPPGSHAAIASDPSGGYAFCLFDPAWGRTSEDAARAVLEDLARQSGPQYRFLVVSIPDESAVSTCNAAP